MCLQLLFAFVACLGAEFFCEPAHIAARCVLAAVVCLCGLLVAKLLCEPAHVAARCVLAAVVCLCGLLWCMGPCVSLHTLLLAVCLQLLFAFVACLGVGLLCEPAQAAARCMLADVVSLCGLLWCRASV